jgi:large subunit ribosomal protein L4
MASKKEAVAETTNAKPVLKLPVRRLDGTPTGEEVELNPTLFGLERNDHVLYLAVKAELTNKRHGTHATKSRGMVRGGGRKPARQKGRGTARVGTIRSPIWKGGGKIFGPQPHDYELKVPLKVKRLARRLALSMKAQSGAIDLVEDFDFDAPKTKRVGDLLSVFGAAGRSALIMLDGNKPLVVKSCRNIPRLEIRDGVNASTYDILRARRVLISRSALRRLEGSLSGEK